MNQELRSFESTVTLVPDPDSWANVPKILTCVLGGSVDELSSSSSTSTSSLEQDNITLHLGDESSAMDQSDEQTALDDDNTFHLFSKLPPELRVKIWNYNYPQSRIISIKCAPRSLSVGSDDLFYTRRTSGCTSTAKIPVNLHVCAESRREALKKYKRSFGIARQKGQIYFDNEEDILYFGPRDGFMASEGNLRSVLSLVSPAELQVVRRVAINEALFWVDSSHADYHSGLAASLTFDIVKMVRRRLPGLRDLVFVPRDENPVYSDTARFVEPPIVQTRISRQVATAVRMLCERFPHWCPPRWRIMTLSAVPDPPVYERGVLGYGDGQSRRSAIMETIMQRSRDMEALEDEAAATD